MNRAAEPTIGIREALYFLAEMAVYVAVIWWAFTRDLQPGWRWLLAFGLVVVFATPWALLVSPMARWPLTGWADVAFRVLWFGLGLLAASAVLLGR